MKVASFVAGLVLVGCVLYACMPLPHEPVFVFHNHPDEPYEAYLAGRLGVIQPTYQRRFLFVAYRQLAGVGFTDEEQEILLPYLDLSDMGMIVGPENWVHAKWEVTGVGSQQPVNAPIRSAAPGQPYYGYPNCLGDAYDTAARTLEERTAEFGAKSEAVSSWIAAQDQVFQNCEGSDRVIPEPAPNSLPPKIRADRQYQIAAAYFYDGDTEEAVKRFTAISRDPNSPWATIAPYLIARTYRRAATLVPTASRDVAARFLEKAEAQLLAILKEPRYSSMHPAARRLLRMTRFDLRPEQLIGELSEVVMRHGDSDEFRHEVQDYLLLFERGLDWGLVSKRDITEWLWSFSGSPDMTFEAVLKRWKEKQTLPWLIAALAQAEPTHPEVPALLRAASSVPPDSPGYATAVYNSLRLRIGRGDRASSRVELDRLLKEQSKSFPPSTLNLLRSLRLQSASSLRDFFGHAPRTPVLMPPVSWDDQAPRATPRPLLDGDTLVTLDRRIPVNRMVEAVTAKVLPEHLNGPLALLAFSRASLLGRHETAATMIPLLSSAIPLAKPYLETYQNAKTTEEREFALACLLLRFSGIQPYASSDWPEDPDREYSIQQKPLQTVALGGAWWCNPDPVDERRGRTISYWPKYQFDPKSPSPAFLTAQDRSAAQREWDALVKIGDAPNYFAKIVLGRAKTHPEDARLPEALHRVVRATRYGCTDATTSRYSQQAFLILHQKYPRSEWTKKTPYWF